MLRIFVVETNEEFEIIRELFAEYADSLGFDLDFQDFKSELANLPCDCAAPEGSLLLAVYQEQGAGWPYCSVAVQLMIVIPAEAGIQCYRSVWIPHQVRNDSPSNYERQNPIVLLSLMKLAE